MKADDFIRGWLDRELPTVLRDAFKGEQVRWRHGRPAGAEHDEPAVTVECLEYNLLDHDESEACRMFRALDDKLRECFIIDAARKLVSIGKAVRITTGTDFIYEQAFKPSNLLEAIARAAQ